MFDKISLPIEMLRASLILFSLLLVGLASGSGSNKTQGNGFYSGWFHIRHWSSKKYIHPRGGSTNPGDQTNLVIHNGQGDATKFRVVEVDGAGEYFYIQHVGGKVQNS